MQSYQNENAVYRFNKIILEEVLHCQEVIKKHFKKELVISKRMKDILGKPVNVVYLIDYILPKSIRVKDHCHIAGKYIGSAHQICNANYKLVQKIAVIFYNLKGHDSHEIMQEISKFDQKKYYTKWNGKIC